MKSTTYIEIAEIGSPFLYTHSQQDGWKSNFIILIMSEMQLKTKKKFLIDI